MKTNWNTQNNSIKYSAYLVLVEKIYNQNNTPSRYNGSIESMLREFFSKTSQKKHLWKRQTFKELLVQLYQQKCYALLRNYSNVNVLHNISFFGNVIVRPIEDWKNNCGAPEEQLKCLVQHCFALYETPKFLESAFFASEKKHMLWYVQLGKGKSVKSLANMPVELTSKMAHEFRNAPYFLTINEALRYAQAIGFGASKKEAKLIALSRLSVIREEQEVFWASVVQFFSKESDLNVGQLDSVMDYLSHKYREDSSFSMKNRTYNALLSQSEEWHRIVYLKEKEQIYNWKSSGIKPLYVEEIIDNKKVIYETKELLNTGELFDEGNAMQHCVAEYGDDCVAKQCSVFSLRQIVEGEPIKRLATLEIELKSFQIVQAKAKCNQEPESKSMELINHWIDNSQLRRKSEEAYQSREQVEQPIQARVYQSKSEAVFNKNTVYIIWLIIKLMLLLGKAMSM
ncbi:MAG: PcfJ domain-containing protein [Psychroserpens sp.]|nr:PcfJ domain-containing protein [Psychroserpens sp.]